MKNRHGFILIIVLALLGVMAFLALELVEHSRQARTLSMASVLDTHTQLLARSGIEKGKQEIYAPYLASPPLPLAAPHPYQGADLVVSLPIDADGDARVRIGDSNGKICLNDGLAAGKAENITHPIPGGYRADALDPWPPALPGAGVQDISAWINLRLRRILNAYGDVHKFASDMQPYSPGTGGWPAWKVFDPEPTYNHDFKHTATDGFTNASGHFQSLPPRLFVDGSPTANPQLSAGLGDRIIGARPAGGYIHLDQVRDILNRWGAEFLTATYLNGQGFFDMAESDFILNAWTDTAFWRMKREFGANDTNFPNHARVGPPYTTLLGQPQSGVISSIDFRDLWRPHPLPPINLNAASDAVRAAIFQAPADIRLLNEGSVGWDVQEKWDMLGYLHNIQGFWDEAACIGTCNPVINASLSVETNGGSFTTAAAGALGPRQFGRLISVRDAMIVSQAYAFVAARDGWPDSFERFAWHLRRIMIEAKPLERARAPTYGTKPRVYTTTDADNHISLDQWGLVDIYPQILSLQRRLPGWMGAPLALVSPWRTSKMGPTLSDMKVEDFVFRSHLPKVIFLPTGQFSLTSHAQLSRGPLHSRRRIGVRVQAFETTAFRDQASFLKFTDLAETSTQITFGPEPQGGGVPPSSCLGTVGLHDRGESVPATGGADRRFARYDFKNSLDPNEGDFAHVAATDPPLQVELTASSLEGNTVSIFPGAFDFDCGDFSPFGGIYLSDLRYNYRTAVYPKKFHDSFYFRPETFLLSPVPPPGEYIGNRGNKGLISCWVRVPSFNSFYRDNNVFHLTLWERLDALRTPVALATEMGRLRPITLSLNTKRTWLNNDYCTNFFSFSIGIGNDSQSGGHPTVPARGYQFQLWPELTSLPLPVDQADYLANPRYGHMMFPWNRVYDPSDYLKQFRAPNILNYARETGIRESMNGTTPYVFRPGGWVRLVSVWDSSRRETHLDNMFMAVPHSLQGIQPNPKVPAQSPGLFHPKMMLSWGERPYLKKPSNGVNFGGLPGWLYRPERLDSCVDNVVMVFGALPASFDLGSDPSGTNVNRQLLWDAIQNIPGFNSRRYDIRNNNEPSWVIDPKLPAGSKILQFGARIYDVPFTPEYGPDPATGNIWASWPVKAPRVDPDLLDVSLANFQDNPLAPVQRASTCHEWGITLKSREWASYNLPSVTATTRFRLRYRNQDTVIDRSMLTHENDPANLDGRPLDDVLTDIPWIQEVSWRWIPPGGMKVLSWEQE